MTKRYDAILAVPLLAVLLIGGWWLGDDEPEEAPEADVRTGREVVRERQATRTRVAAHVIDPPASEVEEALEEMELAGASLLRCPTELDDGLYEVVGELIDDVRFVTVSDGRLFAAAWADEGRAELAQEAQQVGWLSWSDAGEGWSSCRVEPLERATVSGRAIFADEDTTGHALSGCLFGDVVDLDETGAFELPALVGRPCYLYVVRTAGERFGKGQLVEVAVDGDVDGVELHAPGLSQLWDASSQALIAASLADTTDGRLLQLAERERPELALDDPELAPVLQAWADQEDARQLAMADHVDRLHDPDEQQRALVDAFLGLY